VTFVQHSSQKPCKIRVLRKSPLRQRFDSRMFVMRTGLPVPLEPGLVILNKVILGKTLSAWTSGSQFKRSRFL